MAEATETKGEAECGVEAVASLLGQMEAETEREPAAPVTRTKARPSPVAPIPHEDWDSLPTMPQPANLAPMAPTRKATMPDLIGSGARIPETGPVRRKQDIPGMVWDPITCKMVSSSVIPRPAPAPVATTVAPLGRNGMPQIEAMPAVQAAQAEVDRVSAQVAETAKQIAELEQELGLPPGRSVHSSHSFDKAAAQLLAEGKADHSAEKFARLETHRIHARRLALAQDVVNAKLASERHEARLLLSAQAVEEHVTPADAATARALLEFAKCFVASALARGRLAQSGFSVPRHIVPCEMSNDNFWIVPVDVCPKSNQLLSDLIARGLLTRKEVLAALPDIKGI